MSTPGVATSTRSHLYRDLRDSDGNVVPNVEVTVYERGSTQLVQQVLYSGASGSAFLTNPFTTSSGAIDFYLDQPQDVRIGVAVAAQGGTQQLLDDVPVMPPSNQLVRSPSGFRIVNAPVAGYYLQASDNRTSYWVSADEVMASRPTPTVQLKQYDFSASYLDDLRSSGTTSYVDTSLDIKPPGTGFLQALAFTGSVSVPALDFVERGRVIFLYKVLAGSGSRPARMRVSIDDRSVWTLTPTSDAYLGVWLVGYLEVMAPGSHVVVFDQEPGDPDSSVLLGPVTIEYGDNIPPHTHAGTADDTVVLGTGARAINPRATSLGDSSLADVDGTAVGANAQAYARGTAVGSKAWAGQDALALGYDASGHSGTGGWVALGAQANAGGDSAVALGWSAEAGAANAIAIGPATQADGQDAIAVGHMAEADGYRSIALGSAARAPYDFSMAIGPGVVTQAAHEARLGGADTVVVVPGSLRHTGSQAVLGAASTKLGFYGSAPVVQPVVRGSRNGNQVLTQLLAQLNAMGLIQDASTP